MVDDGVAEDLQPVNFECVLSACWESLSVFERKNNLTLVSVGKTAVGSNITVRKPHKLTLISGNSETSKCKINFASNLNLMIGNKPNGAVSILNPQTIVTTTESHLPQNTLIKDTLILVDELIVTVDCSCFVD